MKTKFITLFVSLFIVSTNLFSQMVLKSVPESGYPEIQILIMEDGTSYLHRQLVDVLWDNTTSILENVILKNDDLISLKIPENATIGFHTIKVIMDDNIEGVLPFNVTTKPVTGDDQIDGTDPDPDTQRGDPIWAGKKPKPIKPGTPVYNPSGGYPEGHNIPCDLLHKIDGVMTDSVYENRKEWSNIYPLPGKFSYLYLDYCDDTKTMYVLNDWFNGTGRYDSNSCYNKFQFKTGGGLEEWEIRVFHSYNKPVEVFRNGINVSEDTNYVLGGRYGNEETVLVDSAHTIYEFGIRVISGVFFMPVQHDPYSPPQGPSIEVICNDDGYGLVPEPTMLVGNLGNGITATRNDRYIPIQGVAGLVLEPFSFSGELWSDSSSIRITGENAVVNRCSGNHIIDGLFSENEWTNSQPAIGKYSNLYADYCDGVLFILNDWILGTEEPDEENCYNLFELYTGDASEHWGIYVYHDTTKGIKVFRNGEDVSNDTNIVFGGKFNFDKSPNLDTAHTIYEFGIKVAEGNWHLFMCDPGPASFCDTDSRPAPRTIAPRTGIRSSEDNTHPGDHSSIIQVSEQKHVKLIVGTSEETSNWFSRNFKANINFDPNIVKNIIISLPDSNLIADSLNLTINNLDTNIIEVLGSSNENFKNSGDLFIIEADVMANGKNAYSELNINVLLANRTTYMRQFNIPKLLFDITTGIDGNLITRKQISILNLYPNPNVNSDISILEFNLDNGSYLTVELFDILGNKQTLYETRFYDSGLNMVEIKTESLVSGSYFIRLRSDDISRVIKFEVIK